MNRYEEILKRTQYFVAKNYEITSDGIDKTLIRYWEDGGSDKYLIFEERWSIDAENNMSEIFAKTTLKKSNEILELFKENNNNTEQYIKNINIKVQNFVRERLRELKLFEYIFKENKTLQQKIGKKQFEIAFKNYSKKIKEIEYYFNSLGDELKRLNDLKNKVKTAVYGTYDLRKEKERIRYQEDIRKEKELKRIYKEKLNEFLSKKKKVIKKAIKRIIYALQEKMLYLIETKYITTKKIIFKAHYKKNGEFWYLTKVYDKNYIEAVKVCNEQLKEKLLSA